jgi:hypothetical protein
MKIEIDGVGIVEIDDAFADLTPEEQQAVVDRIRAQASGTRAAPPASKQRTRAAAQGLTMGFADEIEAALRNPLDAAGSALGLTDGSEYSGALDDIRGKLEAYRNEDPLGAIGYEVGGAVLPALGAGLLSMGSGSAAVGTATAARLAPTLARIAANPVARSAATGAVSGGISGFGAGEGGFTERLGSAGQGAVVGGALGGTLPIVVQKAGQGIRTVADSFGVGGAKRADTFAQRKMVEALGRDGLTPDEALKRLTEAQDMGVADITPADLGENLRGSAWRSQAIPNPNRNAVVEQFAERQSSQAGQIADTASRLSGVKNTGYAFIDDLDEQVRREAKPLYDEAYRVMLDPKPFQPFMGRKVIVEAYRKAVDLADIRGDGNMPPLDRLLRGNALPTEAAHQIKQGLDALIEAETDALTGKVTSRGRELVRLKSQWNDAITTQNDAYRKANVAFSDRARLRDAFTAGAKFNGMPEEELVRMVNGMTPAEREALKSGVITKVQDLASGTTDATNFVKTVFGSPKRRMALRLAFNDPKAFETFERFIKVQADKVRTTRKVMGGSETVERKAAMDDGGIDRSAVVSMGMNAASGNTMGLVGNAAQQVAARASGMSEKSAEAMSRMLFETDPAKQREMLNLLLRREIMDRNSRNTVMRRPETYAGFLGNMSGLLSGQ